MMKQVVFYVVSIFFFLTPFITGAEITRIPLHQNLTIGLRQSPYNPHLRQLNCESFPSNSNGKILTKQCTRPALSSQDFLIKNYTDVAITTDLEPDDVLALAILFEEANLLYKQNQEKKYPIDLIIVGEGNTTIKRMRMEKLLQEYFDVPSEVTIPIVEARATHDNIFTYDGEEFFEQEDLRNIPFPQLNQDQAAIEALSHWIKKSTHPFLIVLKPSPEILYLDASLTSRVSALLYGSFNIRKTVLNPTVLNDSRLIFGKLPNHSQRLEAFISHLSHGFSKVAILEGFGVLEDQSCICSEYEWTHTIGQIIETSDQSLIKVFRTLCSNWNSYIVDSFVKDCEEACTNILLQEKSASSLLKDIHSEMKDLKKEKTREQLSHLHQEILALSPEISRSVSEESLVSWKAVEWKIGLAKKIFSSNVQFTLSDILVAMATTDQSHFFQATPIKASYNERGFLIPIEDPTSNVVYYNRVDRSSLAHLLEAFLNTKIDQQVTHN